jgi:Ni,Fe-hydrogenase maturation factor
MKIIYFGNPYIKEDSLAIKVVEKLKISLPNFEFLYIKDTFQLLDLEYKDCLLLDVAENIDQVKIVDVDKIKTRTLSSLHDFDLGFFLNLSAIKVKIIVIPLNYNLDKSVNEVEELLNIFK